MDWDQCNIQCCSVAVCGVCACVRACVRACVHACASTYTVGKNRDSELLFHLFPSLCHVAPCSGDGFNDDVLGIAPVGSMCRSSNAGLATLRSSTLASATTAAHELGHMFGLNHDGGSFHRHPMHRCCSSDVMCV